MGSFHKKVQLVYKVLMTKRALNFDFQVSWRVQIHSEFIFLTT